MRLTTMTDYAMRLLMYAAHCPDRLCTIAEIAQAYGISKAHLMKITHQLGQAGFITTVRGKGGGLRLAAPPEQINLGAVVRYVEADLALVECFAGAGNRCALTGQCRMAGILGEGLAGFMAHLDRYTLADLTPDAGQPSVKATIRVARASRKPASAKATTPAPDRLPTQGA